MKHFFLDIETYKKGKDGYYYPVLGTDYFVLGCIQDEKGLCRYFYTAKDMWNFMEKTMKNEKEAISWWGHWHIYDHYGYFKHKIQEYTTNERYVQIRQYPLIAKIDNKSWFLDTMSYYPGSLENNGKELGYSKLEMPQKVKKPEELIPYITQDVNITRKLVKILFEFYKELGFNPRKFITGPTTAMNCFISFLSKKEKAGWIIQKGEIHKNKDNINFIQQANRGGRSEVFQSGKFDYATKIDLNSAYWKAMQDMPFPDLLKEKRLKKNVLDIMSKEALLEYTGVIECSIKTKKGIIGLLPVRHKLESKKAIRQIYPSNGEIIMGTWTTHEIRFAIENGYELIDVKEAIIWEKDLKFNYLGDFIQLLWNYRYKCKDKVKLGLIKRMGNSLYGKFIQNRRDKEYKWVKREDINLYLQEGWKHEATVDDYCLSRDKGEYIPKYSSIILGTLIPAHIRVTLTREMLKIPREDLLQCDTDSITFINNHTNKFKIGKKLGEFKEEACGETNILTEKVYYVGNDIHIAGLPKKEHSKEIIDNPQPKETQIMIGMHDAIRQYKDFNRLGQFKKVMKTLEKSEKYNIKLPEVIQEVDKDG